MHSIILAASSEYFQTFLLKNGSSHQLDFVEAEILSEVIRFCYLGEIRLTSVNVEAVLLAAHRLGIKRLELLCGQYFESTLDVENCLRYALIAEKCGLKSSKDLAQTFFANNCSKICKLRNFKEWNALNLDGLAGGLLDGEIGLFNDLMKQIQLSKYKSYLPELLSKDLFPAIFRSFVSGFISEMNNFMLFMTVFCLVHGWLY